MADEKTDKETVEEAQEILKEPETEPVKEETQTEDNEPNEESPETQKAPESEPKPTKEKKEDTQEVAADTEIEAEAPSEEKSVKAKPKGPKKPVGLPPDKILLFGKYNLEEVVVHDPSLERYLNIEPIIVPHTGAKHANKWFGKSNLHIIERLLNNLMRTEEFTGKKSKAYSVLESTFEIIEKRTKSHPVQVLVDALENSAPREEITRLRYGGISVPKAVDTSSSRRLDIAFRNICKGAVASSYKNSKSIEMCLANEIILASKKDMNSFAVSKKEEVERVAASAR